MKKRYALGFILILSFVLVGCTPNTEDAPDQIEENDNSAEQNDESGTENENELESDQESDQEGDTSENDAENEGLEVETGSTETVTRMIEGMENEVEVVNYHLTQYGISYQLDTLFGEPEVNGQLITYTNEQGTSEVSIEIMTDTSLDEAVEELQAQLETGDYEEKGKLEDIPVAENGLEGKMQYVVYPVRGFYAYDLADHVLVISYTFPAEAGDGMYPLLESLRQSIQVQ
ncbi:hypothetical protein [Caldalkalibacillus salinus]|uniref:hypothetical protein n=1 Tax=Caldalkalibacillus salinus TaxID=2803787 RepID=UPI0019244F95|nr:hypothetical protein [Caldalkalibacillus salinus]